MVNKNFLKLFITFLGFIFFITCGDSLKNRLERRLNNFRNALPDEIREKFDNNEYEEAGKLLDERLKRIRSYIDKLPDDESKKKFIRGNYEGLDEYIKKLNISEEDLEFNKKIYKVIDYECIPTFNGYEMVDFFRVYFKEKLKSME